ncbi:MAG: electron transport protein SCO1/SenC [Crocinitomicaceae bacterium]|nr:electron transport protein SCO1/SenC [Crocinitomicaceae bacterium]
MAILFSSVLIAYFLNTNAIKKRKEQIKVINPIDLPSEMVDPSLINVGVGHKIKPFKFTNQYNELIELKEVEECVFVAEYFFTTCPTICPIMNKQMQRVQKYFTNEKQFKILSFTVHPEVDTVEQLLRYAKKHNAVKNQWHFLTGSKKQLYESARKSFFLLKPAEVKNQGDVGSDFIHTNNFVLVDKFLQIRGYYDGTNPKEIDKLIRDAENLITE